MHARIAATLGAISVLSSGSAPAEAPPDDLAALVAPSPEPRQEDLSQIVGKSTEWGEVAVKLWRRDDARSYDALKLLLTDMNWDRQREVASAILKSAQPDKDLTPHAQEILDLSRMAAKLKLRGALDVTISNFTITAQAEDSAPDWQTEVEVTPRITGPNFDHTFRSTVLWPSLASGASVFTEAYADPFFFKEPGRYVMDLDVKVTAQDKNLQGESVYRRVQGAAILGEGGTWQNVMMAETVAQSDVARIRDAISSNQLPLAKQIDHPLREQHFPNLPLLNADGVVTQIADAKFFARTEFTIIKASFVGCPPCILAEPRMETLSEYPGIQALTLVAQTARDPEIQKIAPRYLAELKGREYSHPWFIVDSNALAALSVEGFPTYFIVDTRGKVIDTRAGGAITPEYVRGLSRDQARK